MKWMMYCGALYVATALGLIGVMAASTYDVIKCETNITVSVK